LCWQLRGEAGERQVPNCKYALQHNIGLGGAVVVGIYKLAPFAVTQKVEAKQSQSEIKSAQFFSLIEEKLKTEGKDLVGKIKAVVGFDVTSDGKTAATYTVDLKNGTGALLINDKCKSRIFIKLVKLPLAIQGLDCYVANKCAIIGYCSYRIFL
jgi:sterol carrier protein 2